MADNDNIQWEAAGREAAGLKWNALDLVGIRVYRYSEALAARDNLSDNCNVALAIS